MFNAAHTASPLRDADSLSDRFDGDWIGGGNLLRKVFELPARPIRARVYYCPLGCGELYINGKRVGSGLLNPAQSDYEARCFYLVEDVSDFLLPGPNVFGVLLGEGWYAQSRVQHGRFGWAEAPYGPRKLLLQLEAQTSAGPVVIRSDRSWQAAAGPIIEDNLYAGEVYDARREMPDWCSPDSSDSGWGPAEILPAPGGTLLPQPCEPIEVVRTIQPVTAHDAPGRGRIIDFGENIAGLVELTTDAPAGTEYTLRFAEELDAAGRLDTASTGVFATGVEQVDRYTAAGGRATWRPRFTYHGFRYVEVTAEPNEAPAPDLTACVVRTAVPRAGHFECSDERLNTLYAMAVRTLESNLHGVLTDCPARERCGWLGDMQVTADFATLNFDMRNFWPKTIDDILTSALPTGPTMCAPGQRKNGPATPAWGSACVRLPWTQWLYYHDAEPIERAWPLMQQWVQTLLDKRNEAGLIDWGLGDWCPPGSVHPKLTPVALTSTAILFGDLTLLARMARLLGRDADAEQAEQQACRAARDFRETFYDPSACTFGSQTADAMALAVGLAPDGAETDIAASLARDVLARDGEITTGILGSRHLLDQLGRFRHFNAVNAILHREAYPGFGDLIARGATTMWETWETAPADEPHPRSRNHPMQAAFAAWFHQGLGGIRLRRDADGTEEIYFAPQFLDGLDWVTCRYDSIRGPIRTAWRRGGEQVQVDIDAPPGVRIVNSPKSASPSWCTPR